MGKTQIIVAGKHDEFLPVFEHSCPGLPLEDMIVGIVFETKTGRVIGMNSSPKRAIPLFQKGEWHSMHNIDFIRRLKGKSPPA